MHGGKRLSLFESATLQLTAWYVLLLMALSLLFSMVLYGIGTNEFNYVLAPPRASEIILFTDDNRALGAREQRVRESSGRLLASLIVFNVSVLVGGTVLSYLLARRTLKPIEKAHEAQSLFASDAAHELRTPLAVMQTEIEVGLRDKKATTGGQRTILESTLEEVSRLRTLTDRLLQLASQQEVSVSEVDVESATVEAVTRVVSLAQYKKIEIDNQVGRGIAKGNFDSIIEILVILLDNAVKYSPKKSKIVLRHTETSHSLDIQVRDEGPGIPTAEQAKIFERFYRADSSRSKENVAGYGLGLSLAKRLAEEMGGHLSVQSNGKKGSAFTLTLVK